MDEIQESNFNDTNVLSTGLELVKTVKTLDLSFAGMITNTYFTCILVITGTLYGAASILFQNFNKDLILASVAALTIAFLSILRLIWFINCGYFLTKEMKGCAHALDRFKFTDKKIGMEQVNLLRQELRYHSESPINPFMAFSVSTSTLVGTLGTIVTYLIVLLQFKVSEAPGDNPME